MAVMRTIGRVVEGLDDIYSMAPLLAKLGRSHARLGVDSASFALMRDCLIEVLEEVSSKKGEGGWGVGTRLARIIFHCMVCRVVGGMKDLHTL